MTTRLFALCLVAGPVLACESGEPLVPITEDAPDAMIVFENVRRAHPFSLQLQFCGVDGPEDVNLDAVMPAHQHGMNYDPVITTQGQGIYQVDGMMFHMPGHWEIRVEAVLHGETIAYTYDAIIR